jgi:multimeric flavodoxin WrbA
MRAIEKDQSSFQKIIDEVESADGVLWAFPLYFLLVHSHYKRFIELISERGAESAFKNKYTAALSTSVHFYDHTAHNYINAICDDLNMKYVGAFSADMYDLLKEKEREKLILFAKHFFEAIENNFQTSKKFEPVKQSEFTYVNGEIEGKVDVDGKKVIILTDATEDQTNLNRMIERFSGAFSRSTELINLRDVDIKGGCRGCIQCGYDNTCFYENKDEYIEFVNTKIKPANILVFAGAVKDRYLSSKWKIFFDRSFFNTHIPIFIGKQIGFVISGPLSQIPNLRQVLEAYSQVQQMNIVDFVTDESENSTALDALLHGLAGRLVQFAQEEYSNPATFLGVGGRKVLRDEVYGRLRFPFQSDHQFYRKHGLYDYPQKEYKTRINNLFYKFLLKIPSMRKEIYNKRIIPEMVKPLQKIVESK